MYDALNSLFRFQIGDWVRPVGIPRHVPRQILARELRQIPGGSVFVLYRVRAFVSGSLSDEYLEFHEFELEPAMPSHCVAIAVDALADPRTLCAKMARALAKAGHDDAARRFDGALETLDRFGKTNS